MGQFFALWIYSFFIFGPLQELGTVIGVYRETEASLAKFQEILDAPLEPRPAQPVPVGELVRLAFDGVGFRHQAATAHAVQDVSFEVRRGETIAFVGPSGAGKTTLVKLLVGLVPARSRAASSTTASRTTSVDLETVRERIGLVTQDTQLFSGSIRENLLFVRPDASDAECLDVLRRAACDSLLARADRGLDTLIGEGGVKVSGGEKQRLSIARALLRRPQLLVFDEATSSLDSLTEEEIAHTIRERGARAPRDHRADRPSAVDRPARGQHPGAGAGPHRRAGPPRGAARSQGPLLRHVAAAGRRATGRGSDPGLTSGRTAARPPALK